MKTIVFDDSIKENIKFCFPLNDDFTITETRELSRPANIEQILTLIQDFYKEPLTQEIIDKLGQVTSAVPAFNATTGEIIDS